MKRMKHSRVAAGFCFTLTLVFAVNSFAEEPHDPRRGQLCLAPLDAESMSAGDCGEVSGDTHAVEPVEEPRRWVWSEAEGASIAIGFLAAGGEQIRLPDPKAPRVQFQLLGDPARDWPLPVDLQLAADDPGHPPWEKLDGWKFSIPRSKLEQPVSLYLPPGNWRFTADAARHLSVERREIRIDKDNIHLGTLQLQAAPRVALRAVSRDGSPAVGALLRDPVAIEALAVADPTGWIEWEPERGELPIELIVEASGFAPATIDVRERTSDLTLDPLILGKGGTLKIVLDRERLDEPVEVELIRNQRRRHRDGTEGRVVATGTIHSDDEEIELELIEPGKYSLHLDGAGPLEHWAEHVEVREADTEAVELKIEPFRLEVKVLLDEQPLPHASIEIGAPTAPGPEWSGALQADEKGSAEAVAWQRSINIAHVKGDDPPVNSVEWFKLDETGDESVVLSIRNMKISGRLIDGDSGGAIADSRIAVRWKGDQSAGAFGLRTDEQGRFEKGSLKPGHYTLKVSLAEYLPLERTVELSTAVPAHEIELVLERGEQLHVRVLDDNGTPMPNAVIIELARERADAPAQWQAGPDGRAAIPMERGGRRDVWLVAAGGTFGRAVLDTTMEGTAESPLPLVMPAPVGRITVAAVDADGNPLPSVGLALRHDKTPIPDRVMDLLARTRGISFRTGVDGTITIGDMPKGLYEWWARKVSGDHTWVGVPMHDPRPPEATHYFSGGNERVVVVLKE